MNLTPEFLEILKIVTPLIFGIVLGYLGYRYQINHGKVISKRERLLEHIVKIEQVLSVVNDLEYTKYRVNVIAQEIDRLGNRNQELSELIDADGEKIKSNQKKTDDFIKMGERIKGQEKIKKEFIEHNKNTIFEMNSIMAHLNECNKELEANMLALEKNVAELATYEGKQENLIKTIFQLDIDAVSSIVDPSGKLSSMMGELILMLDFKSKSTHDEQINLHIKIKSLLDKKISRG